MSRNFILSLIAGVIILAGIAYVIFWQPQFTPAPQTQSTTNTDTKAKATPIDTKDLKIEDVKVGTGAAVKKGDTVVMEYTGTLPNGTKFDSSYDHGQAFTTQIGTGQVIQGWDEGIPGMKIGGERKLTIPPSLGYGDQAMGSIPPNSTLIFDVKLLEIK